MRGFLFLLYSSLVVLVGAFGCGRLDFDRQPEPDATVDGALDSAVPPVDGGLDSATPGDSAADALAIDGATDSETVDGSLPPGLVTVADFTAGWTTEASVYWMWTFTGDAADFDRFELVTGPSEAGVLARDATTTTIGPADNPELDFLILPGNTDRVEHTITFEHAAGTTLFARIIAYDTVGGADASVVVSATTLAPSAEIVLFADANTAGYSLPTTFIYSTNGPYRGTHCYSYVSMCTTLSDCFDNLRRQGIRRDLSAIPAAAFDRAFYEFAIEIDGAVPSYWSDVRLSFTGGTMHAFDWLTLPAGSRYRVIQIPLNQFNQAGVFLDHATATGTNLHMFWVGGAWADGATVRFDEARIRW